jgi:all-trans-retinol 13,14-reductase
VGANTASGHGIAGTMVGGVHCAGEILDRPLLIEFYTGTRLVDPASLPEPAADADLLEFSRGARLREARAAGRAARAEAASSAS